MASIKTVASWLMRVSSRLSRCVFMPMGSTPMMETSAMPMIARQMAISTMVKPARPEAGEIRSPKFELRMKSEFRISNKA